MFRYHRLLIAFLALFALLPHLLVAETHGAAGDSTSGDSTAGGAATGDAATGDPAAGDSATGAVDGSSDLHETPSNLVAALTAWSGNATALEILVVQDFPEVVTAYLREVEAAHGDLLEYFGRYFPETLAAFVSEPASTAAGTGASSEDFLSFLVTERPAYIAWQAGLADSAPDLTLESFVAARFPVVLLALERANESPASRGVSLMAFLAEQGWDHLQSQAQSMVDKVAPFDLPPGSCGCAVAIDVTTSTGDWSDVSDWEQYDGAPLPVIDRAYLVDADGPAHHIYFKRRTKAKDFGEARFHQGDAEMTLRLSCFQGGSDQGFACMTGGCTADLRTKVMYSARAEHLLDASVGKGTASSANSVRLRYNPGQGSEKLLLSHGVATSGEKRTQWDVAGFFEDTFLSLITDIVPDYITAEEAAILEDIEDDKATSMVDGVLNIYHIEGTDSSQAYDMKGKSVLDGTMAPNVTYTLLLESDSGVSGWGRLHAHTRTYAWIDSSFLMAAAARHFTCDAHVEPPEREVWWRYAAAPDAPQGRDFLRETIRSFSLIELNAALPGNIFNGDSDTAGEGSFQP